MEVVRQLGLVALVLACLQLPSGHGKSGGSAEGFSGPQVGYPPNLYSLFTELSVMDLGDASLVSGVGYQIYGKLEVGAIWEGKNSEKLLKFNIMEPKLHVKTKNNFMERTSAFDSAENNPFYAIWKSGKVENVYIGENEPTFLINFKKGLISLFQFQVLDMEIIETDICHQCSVQYISTSPTSITKLKTNCSTPLDSSKSSHPETIFSALTDSIRQINYEMNEDNKKLVSIISQELHKIKTYIKQDAGNQVKLNQRLDILDEQSGKGVHLKQKSLKQVIEKLAQDGGALKEQSLDPVKEPAMCDGDCPTLSKLVKENRDLLKSDQLGSVESAVKFIELLRTARKSSTAEILQALKGVKNKEILQQLCNLVGLTQTVASHQAAKKFLHFDSDLDIDNTEQYLWALATGSQPRKEVFHDLLKISENKNIPKKVFESLILSSSAMAYHYAQKSKSEFKDEAVIKVKNHVMYYLSKCNDNECKVLYLRALKNLKDPRTLEAIINYAQNESAPISVAAMKTLKAMPKEYFSQEVIKDCQKIFYQLNKKYDSSARTLAVDIILESYPSENVIRELVWFLTTNEKIYEVKQFLYQRLFMMADKCPKFRTMLLRIIKEDKKVNNWNILAQRGLTTAFTRPFMNTQWSNGSLVTVQEISGGVLKRGHVDVIIESNGEQKELFSLGLFAGGLSSFIGSNSNDNDEPAEEEEQANAGMELTVQGSQIRPFIFFKGQGELMGHVWSGTASKRTTAFQAFTLLHDHMEWIPLGNGAIAEMSLIGATSFDLAGEVQLSIWSRVAHSVVEKRAGIALQGMLKVDSSFIQSKSEFLITAEPKLNLVSDIDFYEEISLCIQVKQPDIIVKHNINKVGKIPGTKYMLRKSHYKTTLVPGKTYALNRKNNVMCNVIHNK